MSSKITSESNDTQILEPSPAVDFTRREDQYLQSISITPSIPRGIAVVSEQDRVVIHLGRNGVLFFDLDDTLFDTIEPLHDGATGCYAKVVRPLLEQTGLVFTDERWDDFWNAPNSNVVREIFKEQKIELNDDQWKHYWGDKGGLRRTCTGKNLENDSNSFSTALEKFGIKITPAQFSEKVTEKQLEFLTNAAEKLMEIPGAREFIEQAEALGIKVGVCSSSPEHLVRGMLAVKSLLHHFCVVKSNAQKRSLDGGLSSDGTRQAITEAHASPRASCMVGDSISDISAALSDFGSVIIRVAFNDPKREGKLRDLIGKVNELLIQPHGEAVLGDQSCTVFVIGNYDQVVIGQSENTSRTTYAISSRSVQEAVERQSPSRTIPLPSEVERIVDPSGM